MTMNDKPSHDHRVRKRDDGLEDSGAATRRGRHRDGIPKTVLVLRNAVDLRHQEPRLMDMKAVMLLVGIDDRPLFGVPECDGVIDAALVDDPTVDHEDAAVGGPRIGQGATPGDRSRTDLIDPPNTLDALTQHF